MAAGSLVNDVSLNIANETSNPPPAVLDVSDCLITTTTTTTNASANSLGEKSSGPSSLPAAAAAATHGWSPNAQFYQDANLTKPFEISSLLDLCTLLSPLTPPLSFFFSRKDLVRQQTKQNI